MQGKTRCPYCNKNVIVEVPDGATGIQKTKCPNCGLTIKVDVTEKEESFETPIHPLVRQKPSPKPLIAGALLIVVFLLGVAMGAFMLLSENEALRGTGMYEGMVVDGQKEPLPDVAIYLVDDGMKKMAETDEKGYFIISNLSAGKHRIILKKEGYVTKNVTIGVFPFKSFIKERFTLQKGNGTENKKALSAWFFDILPIFASAIIILSIPPLIGSIFCFMRKYEIVAIIGAIFGIFSMGFFIGTVLSIIALVLILLSREEFRA